MNNRYVGSCMCKAVKFSFDATPRFVADCLCESCRKAHGASAVCWVGIKSEEFNLDTDSSALKWYQSSQDTERGFCKKCGTRMFFRSKKWPGETHIAMASLHTPHDLVATKVSFEEELPAWTAMAVRKK